MVITYHGLSCFKLQSGETVLVVDPFSKNSGLTPPRFQADVVISTNQSENHANIETIAGDPFQIVNPGEYEIKGIYIQGVTTRNGSTDANTAYIIEWDGMRLCHLGNIRKKDITEELKEAIGTPDVLFVPVGGAEALEPEEAAALTNQIEPRVVIPMHYKIKGLDISLKGPEKFIKELGVDEPKPEDRFTFKKKDLPQDTTKLVILEPPTK
ncbi:MAG: hypothetical protein A2756_04760 [Candidatus Ryanbacteria bacterium RIFCSPHIGHO2_01_FULL_48_27]|uniref:Lactamase n=1 Tax=Candidatus Ryanbacteria bacterium RIFCSPHIGHO2_01_FULL_48_27 TaxID=1802115 RepID=A0A1G2FZT3_9BACT|nr:MAG: hypothetical protein A2756_04760 [Candidatus Ryanbacteria bacterium RIFCSPHIGHO2_01_FULL_48_27]